MRRAAKVRAVSIAERKKPRPSSTVTLPRIECARRSISAESAAASSARETLGLGRIDHADEARAQAGQGHERERTGLGVELGRDAVVRPRVAEIERQRGLRVVAPVGLDAGGGAAERLASVGADDEPCRDRAAAVEPDRHAVSSGSTAVTAASMRAQARQDRRRARSSAATRCRFSILWPKASRPISAASNGTSGARISRAVSSIRRIAVSGAASARQSAPDLQRLQRRDRAGQQRGGAVVGRRRLRDQRGLDAGRRRARSAAVSPAGPPPTTATSALSFRLPCVLGLVTAAGGQLTTAGFRLTAPMRYGTEP